MALTTWLLLLIRPLPLSNSDIVPCPWRKYSELNYLYNIHYIQPCLTQGTSSPIPLVSEFGAANFLDQIRLCLTLTFQWYAQWTNIVTLFLNSWQWISLRRHLLKQALRFDKIDIRVNCCFPNTLSSSVVLYLLCYGCYPVTPGHIPFRGSSSSKTSGLYLLV